LQISERCDQFALPSFRVHIASLIGRGISHLSSINFSYTESVTIQLDGEIGKLTHPVFTPGNFIEEGGDDP